jgi:PAS domain S-box-containing protein
MAVQLEDQAEEVKRLQRCLSDLVSVLSLSALWRGSEPAQIVQTLLDVLLRMLGLDFAYARLNEAFGAVPVGVLRIAEGCKLDLPPEELGNILGSLFAADARSLPRIKSRLGAEETSIFPVPLGIQGEIGVLVVGSDRAGFPEKTESLILSVAANQVSIGLTGARRLNEQKEAATQLERQVAERTEGLAAANQKLKESEAALHKALEEIKKSEAKLRQVIDAIPTLAWCNLPDGPNEFLNKGWHEYTGLSPEESQGWGWQGAFHPEDLPPLMEKWRKMLVSGESDEIEARLRRHDGVYRWFLIRAQAFRDDSGKIVRWYGTSTDIEDLKRAEEALRARELDSRSLLDNMPGFLARLSPDGTPVIFNRPFLEYLGKTVEEVSNWRTADIVHPDDLAHTIEVFGKAIAIGQPFDFQYRLRRFDGVYQWFRARIVPVRNFEGQILHWNALVTDIDERKRAEDELRAAHSELARVMRVMTMGQLTASIAHEVNQPLSGIITNASTCLRMLDANPPNLEGARETTRRTIRDGHRASDVITRLRTLYSKKAPALESMDLNEAAREVMALSSTEFQRNGVTVRQEYATDLPAARGDRIQLQQVILNLLRNAAEAMSSIDDRPRELLVRTERHEGNQVRLSVKDSGVGFTPFGADKIFEAFYTTKADGMGIGLSVSRSIIEAHDGRLWATPNDGPGATFSFAIPCALEDSADPETRINRLDTSTDAA